MTDPARDERAEMVALLDEHLNNGCEDWRCEIETHPDAEAGEVHADLPMLEHLADVLTRAGYRKVPDGVAVETHGNGPLVDEQADEAPELHRWHSRPSDRESGDLQAPTWEGLFGAAPGINLTGDDDAGAFAGLLDNILDRLDALERRAEVPANESEEA